LFEPSNQQLKNFAVQLSELKLILFEFPDTLEMSERIPELQQSTATLEEFTSRELNLLNQRYLKGVETFIKALENEKQDYEILVSKRMIELQQVRAALEDIRNDSTLNLTLGDTTMVSQITREVNQIRSTIDELDSVLLQQEIILTNFQASISEITISLLDLTQFFKKSVAAIRQKSWSKEVNYLWEPANYSVQMTVLEELKTLLKSTFFP
jgi:DNA polymerase III delta prime subunit